MMRKSTLGLIIVLSALTFYAGCDDGGGGGQVRQGAGVQCPGGGVPPEECDLDRCPCDFYDVPMTEQCWGRLGINPTFETSAGGRGARCSLFPLERTSTGLAIFSGIVGPCEGGAGERCCQRPALDLRFPEECLVVGFSVFPLSSDQTAACRKCLACYAADLNNKGINVSGGPPYMCMNRQATVPQTGQATCYDSDGRVISCTGTGQDGDIQAGVVPPVPRFTDNGQGQTTDNLTRLVWLKNMDCVGLVDWQGALDFANTLADGKCGLTDGSVPGDWRLPNRNELRSLLDFQNSNPPLPAGNPFINVRADLYWTSSTFVGAPEAAWWVEMGRPRFTPSGASNARGKFRIFGRIQVVTAVRNPKSEGEALAPLPQTGQTTCWDSFGGVKNCAGTGQDGAFRLGVVPPDPRFTNNGDGTITDNLTGLVWLRNMDCGVKATWQAALDFANTLADGKCGLTDGSVAGNWRLPNVNELTSLLDLENAGPTLPADNPFLNVQNNSYWTSTTVTGFTSEDRVSAWRVNLAIGDVDGEGKDDARLFVSAVKGPLSPTPTPTP